MKQIAFSLLLVAAVAGCSSQQAQAPPPSPTPPAEVASPLIYAVSTDPASLCDPQNAFINPEEQINQMVFDNLVAFDDQLNIQPDLATSWSAHEDGSHWTFTLRQGVTFHDGSPLTAEAVVANVRRWMYVTSDDRTTAKYNVIGELLESAQAQGDQVSLTFKSPTPFVLNFLAHSAHGIVNPRLFADGDAIVDKIDTCDGTGPFTLDIAKRTTGSGGRIVLEANLHYWAGAPQLSGVVVQVVEDASTRRLMLENGTADLAQNIDPADAPALEANPQTRVVQGLTNRVLWFGLNVTRFPFDSLPVRQAFNQAFDRQTLIDSVYGQGNARPAYTIVGPFSADAAFDQIPPISFDPEQAKGALEASGTPLEPLSVIVPRGRFFLGERVAEEFASQMRQHLGVDVNVQLEEPAVWRDMTRGLAPAEADWRIALNGWSPSTATTWQTLNPNFHSGQLSPAGANFHGYANAEFDALVDRSNQVSLSEDERKATSMQAQLILRDTYAVVPIAIIPQIVGMRTGVDGVRVLPLELVFVDHRTAK